MSPQTLLVLTVAVSLFNGLASPLLGLVFVLWPLWYPAVITPVPELIFYGASLIVATATLLVAALPAALAERLGAPAAAAAMVGLGGAVLITLAGLLMRP